MRIALRLAEILEERGKSLYWLSKTAQISYPTLWTLVRGRSGIQFATLAALCEALEVGPGDILYLTKGETRKKKAKAK